MATVIAERAVAMGGDEVERITQRYGQPDVHIAPDGADGLMMPIFPGVFVRHLSFDVRNNAFTNITFVPEGGMIGRHRHRGPVDGLVLEGSWRYLEYDWIARPGSFIHESPGVIHTLQAEPGMKTYFRIQGALEFFDEADNLTLVLDVFWMINHYTSYCREHGLAINPRLFV